MRILAVLLIAIISLSGCAVSVTYDEPGTTTESKTSSCIQTINGETRPCKEQAVPTGPKENVSVDQRAPLTDGLDTSWAFSVHPGAKTSAVQVTIEGYDGGDASIQPNRGCIKLEGPVTETKGNCSGGSGNLNVALGGNIVHVEPQVVLAHESLPPGDYTLSAKIPQGVADYRVAITVAY